MTDMLLVTGFTALLVYGYWLMTRLDRYVSGEEKGRSVQARLSHALRGSVSAGKKRLAGAMHAMRPRRDCVEKGEYPVCKGASSHMM